jgi:predicted nuclease of predicted toxin-antitoxin system
MKKFLIDANLPYYFSLWKGDEYIHVKDLNDEWTDEQVWNYSKMNNLIIVTKDSDFSNRILLNEPPPRVIHIKIGNLKLKFLYQALSGAWEEVCLLSDKYKLVNVFEDRIEGIN